MKLLLRCVGRHATDGRFGVLMIQSDKGPLPICLTLDTGVTPPGTYLCKRGTHSLDGVRQFTAFEITGVPGHTGILLHAGNTIHDTKNCFLLGARFGLLLNWMAVRESQVAFAAFMEMMNVKGVDEFDLRIEDPDFPGAQSTIH